jgi:hypothetical protein
MLPQLLDDPIGPVVFLLRQQLCDSVFSRLLSIDRRASLLSTTNLQSLHAQVDTTR